MTKNYYDLNADEFYEGTVNLDLSDLYSRYLKHLPAKARILDAGCGSGRDTKNFKSLGYDVTAFDSSEELCKLAAKATEQQVLHLSFQEIKFANEFDGIWACASLLHLKKQELPIIFKKLEKSLKQNGVIYCSFKLGDFEGERNGRYFTDLTSTSLTALLAETKFKIVDDWVTSDIRPGRENEKWLNALLK